MHNLNHALEAFYLAHRALIAWPDAVLEKHGLSRAHHRILFFIARNPGLSVNDLLAKLDVCKQSVNAPLRKLLQIGLVSSEPDDSDKRIKRLRLTPAGASLEQEITEDQRQRLARAFSTVGAEAEQHWFAVMQELTR